MARKDPRQTSLLDLVPCRQHRRMSRERAEFHDLVIRLRKAGITVYAEGHSHRVGGGAHGYQ